MDFLFAGSVNQYTKSLARQTQWQLKKRSGDFQSHKTSLKDYVNIRRASDVLPEDERDDKLTAILNKAQAGKKLSAEEWEYLRAKNPTMYTKLREIEQEAEDYEEALRRCKTRDEAQRLHVSKLGEIMVAAKNGDSGALFRLNRMNNAMTEFTQSKEYHDLPTEGEEAVEREQARKAEQEALWEEAELRDAEREAETQAAAEAEAESEPLEEDREPKTETGPENTEAAHTAAGNTVPGKTEDTKAGTGIPTEEAKKKNPLEKKRKRKTRPALSAQPKPGAGTARVSAKITAQLSGVLHSTGQAASPTPAADGKSAPAWDSAPSGVVYGARAYRQSSGSGAQPPRKVDTGA